MPRLPIWDPNSRTDKGSPGTFVSNAREIHRPQAMSAPWVNFHLQILSLHIKVSSGPATMVPNTTKRKPGNARRIQTVRGLGRATERDASGR